MSECSKCQNLTLEYLDNQLSSELHSEVEEHLNSCSSCKAELEAFQILKNQIDDSPLYEPSMNLQARFDEMLEDEKRKTQAVIVFKKKHLKWALQIAAAILLFFAGFWTGADNESEQQLAVLKEEVSMTRQIATLAMMQQPSASKRLMAVQAVNDMQEVPDYEIIAALGNRLEHDKQINVRLAAARALGKYGNQREVRDILLLALENQKDPSVQLSIIEILVKWKEERAVNPFFELIQQDSLPPIVKMKAEQGIGILM